MKSLTRLLRPLICAFLLFCLRLGSAICVAHSGISPQLPQDPTLLLKVNGLEAAGAQPWHIKLTYNHFDSDGDNDASGTYEEFWASPRKYKRTYTSDHFTQTDVATEGGLYRSGKQEWPGRVETQVRQEVIEPLHRASVLPRNTTLEKTGWLVGATKLPCVVARTTGTSFPYGSPKYCFGPDTPALRYTQGRGSDETTYNQIVLFQGRYVAHDVKITHAGKPHLEISVQILESIAQINEPDFMPSADAVAVGDSIELNSVDLADYIVREPSLESFRHVKGKALLELVIGKDGHVKSVKGLEGPADVQKWAMAAARTIEFRPFLVLGAPVEVKTRWEFQSN